MWRSRCCWNNVAWKMSSASASSSEAKVVARLEHAHILPVYDYGEADGRLYLVMRYIQAGTLKDRIAAGPMDLVEVNRLFRQIGSALDYAHRPGMVHRDVKPSNVLLDDEGDCYLTDFGLAKMIESSVQLTATGVGIGTPAYMSPEQGQGEKADARSDIYALGVMLYEMVTGQSALPGRDADGRGADAHHCAPAAAQDAKNRPCRNRWSG